MKKIMLFSLAMLFLSFAKASPTIEVTKTAETYSSIKKRLLSSEDRKSRQTAKTPINADQSLYFPKVTIQLSCASVTFTEAQSERIVIQAALGGAMWLYNFYNALEALACGGSGNQEMVV